MPLLTKRCQNTQNSASKTTFGAQAIVSMGWRGGGIQAWEWKQFCMINQVFFDSCALVSCILEKEEMTEWIPTHVEGKATLPLLLNLLVFWHLWTATNKPFGGSIEPVKPSLGCSVIKKKKPDTLENGPTCLDWLHRSCVEADTMKALVTQNYTITSWWWTVKWVLKRKSQRRKKRENCAQCTVQRVDKARCSIAMCGLPPIKMNQCFMTVRETGGVGTGACLRRTCKLHT